MAQLKKDGASFINRYSAGAGNGNPSTQWKLCGMTEIQDAVAAGLDFHANSEWYQTRITEGAAAGTEDGKADLEFWKARGLAKGASIYVSWDAYPDSTKWAAVDEYLAAYEAALGGHYHADCYGGTPYLAHALSKDLIKYGWRTNAPSWDSDGLPYQPGLSTYLQRKLWVAKALKATPAAIWQTGNYWYGTNADENMILRAKTGSHLQAIAATPPPPPPAPSGFYKAAGPSHLISPSGDFAVFLGEGHFQLWHNGECLGSVTFAKPNTGQ